MGKIDLFCVRVILNRKDVFEEFQVSELGGCIHIFFFLFLVLILNNDTGGGSRGRVEDLKKKCEILLYNDVRC